MLERYALRVCHVHYVLWVSIFGDGVDFYTNLTGATDDKVNLKNSRVCSIFAFVYFLMYEVVVTYELLINFSVVMQESPSQF